MTYWSFNMKNLIVMISIIMSLNCSAGNTTPPGGGYEAIGYGDVILDDGQIIACELDDDDDDDDCEYIDE